MTGGPVSWRSRSTCPEGLSAALLALIASAPARALGDEPKAATDQAVTPIEVSASAAPRARDPGRVTLPIEEARRVAGTAGDALQAVGSLPGLARPAFDGGKLIVWGAAPADTRVYVDGVEVPALYHGGGLRGVVSADLVQSLDLVPGAYGADYGRALGGLVRLQTRELPAEGVHGSAGADLLDASALVTAAAFDGKLRVALAGRVSYLDRILAGVVSPQVGDFVPIPRYHDYQAKVSLALREDEALDLTLLGSGDALDRTVVSPDPGAVHRESTSSSFERVLLRYTRAFADGTGVVVTPFFGQDQQTFDASYGAIPAQQDETTWRYGVRASARVPFTPSIAASAGLDALGSSSSLFRAGSLDIPAREGDLYVFGQPPGADVNADAWTANIVDVAPYLTADLKLGPVTITPGLRADVFLIEGSRLTPRAGATPDIGFSRLTGAVDPRLAASLRLGSRLTLSGAVGLYHQPPDPADLSAVFGTPALDLQRAVHVSVGEAARLPADIGLELTGYYERLDHLVVRSRLPDPTLAQALTQDGEGRSYGAQILLRRPLRQGLLGLGRLHAEPERAPLRGRPRLPALRLRPDPRARRRRQLRAPRLDGRRPLPRHHRRAAHAGGGLVHGDQQRAERAALRRAEQHPPPRLLPARSAGREEDHLVARGARRLPRRAQRHLPQERRGDHLQLRLQPEELHHRPPHPRRPRRQGIDLMRAILPLVAALGALGCEPDLGDPASLITGTRILAVRGDPAEVNPGDAVAYRALVAAPGGTVPDPALQWAFCASPKPLTENDAVSVACLGDGVRPIGGPSATAAAATPLDACSLFGPDTPPGNFRPRDPDSTGGFYQPVRVELGALVAFRLERVICDLPDAPIAVAVALAKSYSPNQNPTLAPLTAAIDGVAMPLDQLPAGASVQLATGWGAADAETFPVFDADTLSLVPQREALSVSWFVTAGTLGAEVTGSAGGDPAITTATTWLAPATPGPVHAWLVLRDSRGGVDFASYDLEVK